MSIILPYPTQKPVFLALLPQHPQSTPYPLYLATQQLPNLHTKPNPTITPPPRTTFLIHRQRPPELKHPLVGKNVSPPQHHNIIALSKHGIFESFLIRSPLMPTVITL